jgi:ubiquinone biosynthesis protein
MMNWHGLLDETAFAAFLPKANAHFAKPVCDGLAVFLQGLPESHQSAIFSQQATLDPSASLAARLGLLARSSPVLQKIGQILARDQRLSLDLRQHLQQLESLPPTIPWETIQAILDQQLGSLDRLGITLAPPALAEASVAVVVPFRKKVSGVDQHGVFKILKPGIEEQLNLELALLEQVGSHLDERCEELQIPHLDYQEAFRQVREKLQDEIHLDGEQQKITAARKFYATESRVQIPELFDCCTPRVTAMQRIWGSKVTDHQLTRARDRRRLAELIIDAMIAQPVFSEQNRSFFHSDPHAGNLFHTADGRLAILDWSLVGWLDQPERISIVQIMLGAVTHDPQRIITALSGITENNSLDQPKLQSVVSRWLREMRRGQFPGLFWLVGMLDEAVRDARLRLKPDLMMFRKSLYTLEGVVAEVGATTYTFDKVLCVNLLRHLTMEWPSRWFKSPNSHKFATRLSNFDLIQAILGCPSAIARFGMGQGFDLLETCRTSS